MNGATVGCVCPDAPVVVHAATTSLAPSCPRISLHPSARARDPELPRRPFIARARARGFRCFRDLRLSAMLDLLDLLLLAIGVLGLDLFLDREARSTA